MNKKFLQTYGIVALFATTLSNSVEADPGCNCQCMMPGPDHKGFQVHNIGIVTPASQCNTKCQEKYSYHANGSCSE